jgi:hypothetical protein
LPGGEVVGQLADVDLPDHYHPQLFIFPNPKRKQGLC